MAVYQFSALSDGQAISFNPTVDRLNFDQTTIAAGDLSLVTEGSDLRVTVKSGPVAGKDIVLLSTDHTEIATSNFTFADGSLALIGDNSPINTNDHGANLLNGGAGRDLLMGLGGNDTLNGGDNNDSLVGWLGNDVLNGNNGNDWLEGGEGNDALTGSGGQDTFIFRESGATNADTLPDFASNWDRIELDAFGFGAIGAAGRFSSGDARFFAGTAAHDADDRIIFNSATGQIFYDEDGNGASTAQLIATLGAGRGVVATDFTVTGTGTPGGGGTINGTAGDDTLIGTPGPDTINGLGGNDSIRGGEGADSMSGGDGNDTVDGYNHRTFDTDIDVDTLAGGLGNDVLMVDNSADVVVDAGGIDTVRAGNISWTLASGFENLILDNDESTLTGIGNELNNVIGELNHGWMMQLEGRGGNDTIFGGFQNDTLLGGDGDDLLDGGEDVDTMDGGAGNDTLEYSSFGDDDMWGGTGADHFAVSTPGDFANRIHDFATGVDKLQIDGNRMQNVGATGNFTVNDARFFAGTAAHDADDRVIWDGSVLWYDPDGTGSAAQQAVADVVGTVVATDIEVVNGTGGGQTINGTSGNDSLVGGPASDTMFGFAGNDTLDGGGGPDSMDGGSGNDLYIVDNQSDSVVELQNGGIDEVRSSVDYILPDFVNNLTLTSFALSGTGNAIDNVITGGAFGSLLLGLDGNDTLNGGAGRDTLNGGFGNDSIVGGADMDFIQGHQGNDTLIGGDGNDTFWMDFTRPDPTGWGNDVIDGGAGIDGVQFNTEAGGSQTPITVNLAAGTITSVLGSATIAGVENVWGTEEADRITGNAAANFLHGGGQNDTLDGGAGNDTLWGGNAISGIVSADTFIFSVAPGAANADIVFDFMSGSDRIQLDGAAMNALGGSGDFAAGDARFFAGAGASAGHDADDRVVYNTSTGQLWYDSDGSGAGAAQLIATLNSSPGNPAALSATDITVVNGSSGGGGSTINGTSGNDSLVGGAGNDTINGNAGNDTLRGLGGDDSLDGGSGTDLLDGGLGNDFYVVTTGDSLTDAGGNDMVVALNSWALSSGFENLILATGAVDGSGNSASNVIQGNAANNTLRARDGNDTVTGGGGNDFFDFTTAPSAANADTITDFSSVDQLRFEDGAFTAIGATGTWGATDGRFFAAAGAAAGHDANDRVVYNTTTGALYYDADGSGAGAAVLVATLQGAPAVSASDITVI